MLPAALARGSEEKGAGEGGRKNACPPVCPAEQPGRRGQAAPTFTRSIFGAVRIIDSSPGGGAQRQVFV